MSPIRDVFNAEIDFQILGGLTMRNERLTLYVSAEMRERSTRLLEAMREESLWVPPMSRNAWLNLLLERGLTVVEREVRSAQEA